MTADPTEMWQALIEHFENARSDLERELAPLKSGEIFAGRRGADTGFEWVDVTPMSIANLENAITGLTNRINRLRAEHF